LRTGEKILIVAHGNSLRALVKYLDDMSDDAIVALNIPTGIPLIYEFDHEFNVIGHKYLGDPEQIRQATASVADQLTKQ
jgi:2,3-bisphosphoglycerate-dependent phosphoglycerate mutase